MSGSDLILYSTEDCLAQFTLREMSGQVWLTQLEMAELYQTSKQNISLHVQNVLVEGELDKAATVKKNLTVQTEGTRQVKRKLAYFALPMIIAVGYRVRSTRGTQFRQWATRTLGEYLLSFSLDIRGLSLKTSKIDHGFHQNEHFQHTLKIMDSVKTLAM